MITFQTSSSVEFAAVLLDALDRADIRSLSSHLADSACLGSAGESSSLEGEQRDLLTGIAASLRRSLDREPNANMLDEIDTSIQLLRHLVRMQSYQSSS